MKTRLPFAYVSIIVILILSACATSSPVAVSTPTPIPGFSKFEAENIEIWLPDSFQGGDLANDLEVVVGKLKALGSDYDQVIKMIESNPSVFVLWTFDSNIGPTGALTSMNITHEQVLSAMTLDNYVQAVESQLPSSFTVISKEKTQLGKNEAVKLLIEMNESGATAKELMYVVKNENTIWAITYGTGSDEFADRLPKFEQSASTFSIRP